MKKEKLYNGKPMSHWENMARDIVVASLVRAGSIYEQRSDSPINLPQDIASKQLMSLAKGISEPLFHKAIEERNRCRIGLYIALANITPKRKRSSSKKA